MNLPSSNPADSWFGQPPPDFARPPVQSRVEPASHAADTIVNECLNLEAEGEVHEAAAKLRRAVQGDPSIIERFNATRRVLSILENETPVGPDMTARIIASVDERRPFLPRRARRRVFGTRLVGACSVLAAMAVVALVRMQASVDPRAPVADAEAAAQPETMTADAAAPVRTLGDRVGGLSTKAAPRLSLGNSTAYGRVKWGAADAGVRFSGDVRTFELASRSTSSAGARPSGFASAAAGGPSPMEVRGLLEPAARELSLISAPAGEVVAHPSPLLWDISDASDLGSLLGMPADSSVHRLNAGPLINSLVPPVPAKSEAKR